MKSKGIPARTAQAQGFVGVGAGGWQAVLERQEEKMEKVSELAGGYVAITDVLQEGRSAQQVHDSYMSLPKVERDLRALKTGLLEGRLGEKFGTTDKNPQAITCGMRSRRSANGACSNIKSTRKPR